MKETWVSKLEPILLLYNTITITLEKARRLISLFLTLSTYTARALLLSKSQTIKTRINFLCYNEKNWLLTKLRVRSFYMVPWYTGWDLMICNSNAIRADAAKILTNNGGADRGMARTTWISPENHAGETNPFFDRSHSACNTSKVICQPWTAFSQCSLFTSFTSPWKALHCTSTADLVQPVLRAVSFCCHSNKIRRWISAVSQR